jgi:hypothetical protein
MRAKRRPSGRRLTDSSYDDAPMRDPHTGHWTSPVVAAALCIKPRGALTMSKHGKWTPSNRDHRRSRLCVASPCYFAEYFIAEKLPNNTPSSRQIIADAIHVA